MKDRSDDPSHHERTLLPQSYISDLERVSEEEICENLSSQGVTSVKRTTTLILTFNTPTLPDSVKACYLQIPVVPYIPNPLLCFKCQKLGHGTKYMPWKIDMRSMWSI